MKYSQIDSDEVKSSLSSITIKVSNESTSQKFRFIQQIKQLPLIVWYCLIIAIIIVLSFSPFYSNNGQYDISHLGVRFILVSPSVKFYMACSAIISVSSMMFFDFLIDVFEGQLIIDSWERLVIAVCMMIPRIFYIVYPNTAKKLYYGYCISNAFNLTRMFVNISFGCRLYPELFPPIRLGITYLIYLTSVTIKMNIALFNNLNESVFFYSNVMHYIAVVSYIYHVGRFIYKVYHIVDQVDKYEQNRYLICILHILMPAALAILVAILQGIFNQKRWFDGPEDYMTASYIADALITVFFTLIPGHMARRDALETHRLLDMKRIFVRFVSHEIRSPLNVVVGGMNILLKLLASMKCKCDNDEMFKEVMSLGKDIQGSCMSAIDILNDLLNYEKMDAGVFELSKAYVPVRGIFEKSVANWRMSSSVKDISLTLIDLCDATSVCASATGSPHREVHLSQVISNGYYVNIDRRSIDIVIRNLITNAVKFTPSGGDITISFSIEMDTSQHGMQRGNRAGRSLASNHQLGSSSNMNMSMNTIDPGISDIETGKLRVVVRDSGAGISKENIHKLFGQFTQFDSATLQGGGGSGLGLWICHKIIMMHEGIIYATSDGECMGSSFVFELPVYSCSLMEFERSSSPSRIPSMDMDIEMGSRQQVSLTPALPLLTPRTCFWNEVKQMTFLVVDDSPMSRKMLIKLLQTEIKCKSPTMSLKFIQAEDGDIAVEKLRENMSICSSGSVSEVDRIDCVLIDNVMVNMNGPEAVRIMRGELKYGGLIIGITGNALREDLDYFESCGCDKALPKPFECDELFMVLEQKSVNGGDVL